MKVKTICNFGVNFAVQMKELLKEALNAFRAFAGMMGWTIV